MRFIAFILAVVMTVAAAWAKPELGSRVMNGLRSVKGRVAGKGLLHLAHFDHNVRPSRATRRAASPHLYSVWMLSDEANTVTFGSFLGGAFMNGSKPKINLRTVVVAACVVGIAALLISDPASGVVLGVPLTFPKLKEKSEQLNAVRKELKDVFDQAGPDRDMSKVTSIDGDSQAKVEWIRAKNQEAEDLGKEVAELQMLQRSAEIADAFDDGTGEPGADPARTKGFVDEFFESTALRNRGESAEIMLPETRSMRSAREQVKNALFTTGDGWAPESTRDRRIDYSAQELPAVVDLVPMITTDQPIYKFMRETVFTNAAAEVAEGGAKPEATLKLVEAEESIRKIAVWIPVTDEQLEDVPSARAYVESRLRFMLEQRLDQRLLYGNPAATPAQIRGFHNTAGINTQDGLDRDIPDVVLDAATKVRVVGQSVADGVVLHPYDFTRVRLQRTADGIYIWGHPSQVGPATMWGMPVVDSAQEVEGAGLTGAFRTQSLLVVRRGVSVKISDSHDDFFIENKQAIRAEFRAALVTIRPGAFTELDNLGEVTP